MAITVDDVADIANSTLAKYDRGKITDLTLDEQEHQFLPRVFAEERVEEDGGASIKFDIINAAPTARAHGLHDKDQVSIVDVLAQGEIPWRFATQSYGWDLHEFAMNMGEEVRIVNLVDSRRMAAWAGLSRTLENWGWSKPASSSDNLTPYGIKMYITKKVTGSSASSSTGEFGGGNPSNFTSGVAGIDSSSETRWANWTQQYDDVTDDDLVEKMRKAYYSIQFKSPIPNKSIPANTRGPERYVIYAKYDIIRQLEKIQERKNENIGNDLASFDGKTLFRGNPLTPVPNIEDDSDDPVYFINWNVLYIVGKSGMTLRESDAKPVAGMRNDVAVHIDMMFNLKCVDRRRLAVLSTAADND